jgi:hypothetical protein
MAAVASVSATGARSFHQALPGQNNSPPRPVSASCPRATTST